MKDYVKSRIGYVFSNYGRPDAVVTSWTEYGKRCPGAAAYGIEVGVDRAIGAINIALYNHLLDSRGE